jgi:hypothetical protein
VPGHVDPDACDNPEERYNALGNQPVDFVAKGAVEKYSKPSDREVWEWHQEVSF